MTKFILSATILAAMVAATAAPANAAPAWRTALVAQDEDRDEFAFMLFSVSTKLLNVQGLRLKSTTTMVTKLEAEVECNRGENEASRTVTFNALKGSRFYTLPVPIRGGICSIDISFQSTEAGRVSLLLQYR